MIFRHYQVCDCPACDIPQVARLMPYRRCPDCRKMCANPDCNRPGKGGGRRKRVRRSLGIRVPRLAPRLDTA